MSAKLNDQEPHFTEDVSAIRKRVLGMQDQAAKSSKAARAIAEQQRQLLSIASAIEELVNGVTA